MLPTPTKSAQEALYNRNVTIPPHEDQGGGTEHGIPAGGTTNQVLAKKSDTDYDVEWKDAEGGSGVPEGGTTGQALVKKSDTDGDVEWGTIRQLPASPNREGYYLKTNFMGNPMWGQKDNIEYIQATSMDGIANPYVGSGIHPVTPGNPITLSLGRAIFQPSINIYHLLTRYWDKAYFECHTDFCINEITGATLSNVNNAFNGVVPLEATWIYSLDFYVAADPANPDPSTDTRLANGTYKRTNPIRYVGTNTLYQFVDSAEYQDEDILMTNLHNMDYDWEAIEALTDEQLENIYLKMDLSYSARIYAYPADATGALPSINFTYTIDENQGQATIKIIGLKPESESVF